MGFTSCTTTEQAKAKQAAVSADTVRKSQRARKPKKLGEQFVRPEDVAPKSKKPTQESEAATDSDDDKPILVEFASAVEAPKATAEVHINHVYLCVYLHVCVHICI